ncbi:MAG: capsule biosynthesis protein CapC [Sphaerochaetaceae bacterium]|nr:capsule biosynthesis protein CapC [Sphaerochaetaceae bacterium]
MGFLDFHSHLLFDVDHGVSSREQYKALLLEYKKYEIDTLVLTPHLFHPSVTTKVGNIRENFRLATEDAAELGIRTILGAELYMGSKTEIKTIPIAGRYALVELSVDAKPIGLDRKLKQLIDQGLEPVIAHVERYPWLKVKSETFDLFMDLNCLIQVNVSGIENKTAMPYIQQNIVDIIADDNHGDPTLPKRLRDCLDAYPSICMKMDNLWL